MEQNTEYRPFVTGADDEREIDLKQLLLTILRRWPLLLAVAIICCVIGCGYAVYKEGTGAAVEAVQEDAQDAAGDPDYELEYYERMVSLHELWIREAWESLEEGMPDEIPAEQTRIDVALSALQVLAQIKTAEANRAALEEPETARIGNRAASSLVKYGAVGFVGGLFLALFVLALWEILTQKVLSAEELSRRYRLHTLSVIGDDSGKKKIIGADAAYGRMSAAERMDVLEENLSVYAPDVKEILFVGSASTQKLKELTEACTNRMPQISFSYAAHINENAASMRTLKEHAHVILVEEIGASRYGDVDRVAQLLSDWKKHVIGTVMVV